MNRRYMSYDGEGAEVGYLTLDEAREQYYDAALDKRTETITVFRDVDDREMYYWALDDDDFVAVESADGWSIHAPGSTDEDIASGDAPPLVSGPWDEDWRVIPRSAYDAARLCMARAAEAE